MDIDVTVDIKPEDVLDEMKTKDIIKYLINSDEEVFTSNDIKDLEDYIESSTSLVLSRVLLEKLDPWEVLKTVAAPYIPRNCTDKQSILDGIQEYLSRLE